jgi:hypothetical protein
MKRPLPQAGAAIQSQQQQADRAQWTVQLIRNQHAVRSRLTIAFIDSKIYRIPGSAPGAANPVSTLFGMFSHLGRMTL